jgi:hypothetical protein
MSVSTTPDACTASYVTASALLSKCARFSKETYIASKEGRKCYENTKIIQSDTIEEDVRHSVLGSVLTEYLFFLF